MFEKLKATEEKFEDISNRLTDPEVIGDNGLYAKLMKEYKSLSPIVEKYREYCSYVKTEQEAQEMLDESGADRELKDLARAELDEARENIASVSEELKILLIPKDPNDDRNVIVEIRGGAGGDEASLFANSLFRMYSMYAEARGWKIDVLNANPTELGGFKEISFSIEGEGAYSRLKYESGVHRVQRVPETESQGRIQIDVFRASGAGGQHINKTESAVRITHLPTGLVVECQDERSQHKNKDKAMKILRSRLYDMLEQERNDKIASDRRSQVGTGSRSERIRTYNFPEGRLTDHRIGLTIYRLEYLLNGNIDEVIDALATADQAAKLSAQGDE